jgi:AP-4 complex subunit sigma-1
MQCPFFDTAQSKVVYRRFASLYFVVGVPLDENEFVALDLIRTFVESLNLLFKNVSELDLLHGLEKVHMLLDGMIADGTVIETSRQKLVLPIEFMHKLG